jgi:hypothetical protein
MALELLGEIAHGLLHGCLLSLSEVGVYNAGMDRATFADLSP